MVNEKNIAEAIQILKQLGMPRAQENDRSALCLLALLNLTRQRSWSHAANPLIGITPMMEFARDHYDRQYAPNTRETFRRQTIHQLVDAGIVLYNPDELNRPVNSPKAVYQIEPSALVLLRSFGSKAWERNLERYMEDRQSLVAKYAREREMHRLSVRLRPGREIHLSPGAHSTLIKEVVESFASRFVPNESLMYVGDTGQKIGYVDEELFTSMGITIDSHGKMPDIIFYDAERQWLLLVECVTSHGPVDEKRYADLAELFSKSNLGLVYVTAYPSRSAMVRYLRRIAWETEVWCADSPSHLIHFDGERFLGPYAGGLMGEVQVAGDSLPSD